MSFEVDITKFVGNSLAKVERFKRGVSIKLFSAVIQDTPVLTGRLRGNWQTTIASPALGVIQVRSGTSATEEVLSVAGQAKLDQPIIMRNNLPYAARIEYDGWSHTKAPAGMVRINFARIRRILQEEIARRSA